MQVRCLFQWPLFFAGGVVPPETFQKQGKKQAMKHMPAQFPLSLRQFENQAMESLFQPQRRKTCSSELHTPSELLCKPWEGSSSHGSLESWEAKGEVGLQPPGPLPRQLSGCLHRSWPSLCFVAPKASLVKAKATMSKCSSSRVPLPIHQGPDGRWGQNSPGPSCSCVRRPHEPGTG